MTSISRARHLREGFFYLLALVLIAYCFVLHVGRLEQITFVIHDDILADLTAQAMRSDGITPYLSYAHYAATRDGRFFYYYSMGFLVLPHLFDSAVARSIFISIIQFASLISIGLYLAFIVRRPTAVLFVALSCAFLPNWSLHFPVTSLPIVFQSAILLFFSSLILYRLAAKRAIDGQRSPYLRRLSYILFLLSCLVAEAATFFFLLLLLLDAVHEEFHITRRLDWHTPLSLLRRRRVLLFILVAIVIVYIVTRPLYHPTYTGTQLSLDPSKALPILLRYAIRGLPAANFITPDYFTVHWLHRSPADVSLRNLAQDYLNPAISFLLILLSGTYALYFWRWRLSGSGEPKAQRTQAHPWRSTHLAVFVCSLVLAFAVQIPLAVTVRYQSQLLDVYYPTYFSFLCFIVALAVLPLLLQPFLATWSPWAVRVTLFLAVCLVGYACFLTQVANRVTFREQAAFGRRWKLINAWFETDQFRNLPSSAVVVSPALWQGINETVVPDYWTNYIQVRTGRKVPVRRDMARLGPSTPVYYLHLDNRDAGSGGALFVSEVNWKASAEDASGFVLSDNVTVVSDGEPRDVALSVLTRPAAALPPKVRALETTDEGVKRVFGPLRFQRERHLYETVISVPRAVSGTATLIDAANVTAGRNLLVP